MKYIIELDEIPNTGLYKARGANTLVFDRKGIENILKPYKEEGVKTNNFIGNLECVSCKDNIRYSINRFTQVQESNDSRNWRNI